jgi:hypothetical protein
MISTHRLLEKYELKLIRLPATGPPDKFIGWCYDGILLPVVCKKKLSEYILVLYVFETYVSERNGKHFVTTTSIHTSFMNKTALLRTINEILQELYINKIVH